VIRLHRDARLDEGLNVKNYRTILIFIVSAVLAAPIAVVATFMLWRFWDWFERKTGIESLGHSGPAEWCYLAIYTILVSVVLIALVVRQRRRV